jgi:glycosyltransferase involved in cell wall biosynthesis
LYPAQPWPHKNHERLVAAFANSLGDLPPGLQLVFTGRPFTQEHPAARLVAERGLGSRIRHLGLRSPLEVRALFQECEALVFPSLFEGFGMPVAEAIIAGKPVACSNRTSLPEIAGDAALMFDPTDTGQIGASIVELFARPGLRQSLANEALRRRTQFGARRSALATLGVYERAFGMATRDAA